MEIWNIGFNSWIIQDGNYTDFIKNEKREFALEYYSRNISLSQNKNKECSYLNASKYIINGEVIFIAEDIIILDFGILAYSEDNRIKGINVGDYVKGDIYLGLDPFDYFETFYSLADIPPLIYKWELSKIFLVTTPIIETKREEGGILKIYDSTKHSIEEIEKTNGWEDREGFAEYILQCLLISNNPSHRFSKIIDTT